MKLKCSGKKFLNLLLKRYSEKKFRSALFFWKGSIFDTLWKHINERKHIKIAKPIEKKDHSILLFWGVQNKMLSNLQEMQGVALLQQSKIEKQNMYLTK